MKKLNIILLVVAILSIQNTSSNIYAIPLPAMQWSRTVPIVKEKEVEKIESIRLFKIIIEKDVLSAQILTESAGNHLRNGKLIKSTAGALGIAQFLPTTWDWLKKVNILPKHFDIANEEHQIKAQKLFMNYLANKDYGIKYDKTILALAAYNAGSGRVTRLIKKYGADWESHLPGETKKYISRIIKA